MPTEDCEYWQALCESPLRRPGQRLAYVSIKKSLPSNLRRLRAFRHAFVGTAHISSGWLAAGLDVGEDGSISPVTVDTRALLSVLETNLQRRNTSEAELLIGIYITYSLTLSTWTCLS